MARRRETGDRRDLRRRLRREAAADRPAFSSALQTRIEASLSAEHGPNRRGSRQTVSTMLVGSAAAACLALAAWLGGWRDPRPGEDEAAFAATVALPEPAAIDELPLWDELGGDLLAGTAELAAEAIGMPRWNDLVAAGAVIVGPGDDLSSPISP